MFDKNSDYAHNKCADAIVYISVTGTPVTLTRADFASEDEFLQWKRWSDGDYKATEQSGRSFYDNCISLDESLDCIGAVQSVEDMLVDRLTDAELSRTHAELFSEVKSRLTVKQFRRLWMLHVDGMSIKTIAVAEKVKHQSVSESISTATKNIAEYYEKTLRKRSF